MSVFTKVSHTELRGFLHGYPLGELIGYQGIGEGVENTNYFVDTDEGRWVLTLFERLDANDLPFFLGLMEHLSRRGFPSAMPVPDGEGRMLKVLNEKPAALVMRLTGQSVLFPNLAQCAAVGRALADLHIIAASYRRTARNGRGAEWRRTTAETLIPKVDAETRALLEDELATQQALDLAALPQGVIHADLFKDNVLFVDDRLSGVIDFYYACNDALVYDLAVTLNDWAAESDGHLNASRGHALLEAYCARREPTAAERETWNLTLRAAALRFWLSRLYDWTFPRSGDVVHMKDPEHYRRVLVAHRERGSIPLP